MHIAAFIVSFALFIGGLLLMGYAFDAPGFEFVMFAGGILLISLAVAIPAHVLKRADR